MAMTLPRLFQRLFEGKDGVSPSEARKYIGKLTFYERLVIQVILKGEIPMKYNIIERDSFQVIGIKREFSLVNGENLIGIPKLWDKVNSDGTDDQLGKLNNGQIKGLLGVCVDKRILEQNETMDYWIATEYDGQVPEGYSSLTIPASKWVIFEVHGPMPDAIQEVWKRIFRNGFLQAVMNMLELLKWKFTQTMMLQTLITTPRFGFLLNI